MSLFGTKRLQNWEAETQSTLGIEPRTTCTLRNHSIHSILGYGYGPSTIFKNSFTGLRDGSMCTVAYGASMRAEFKSPTPMSKLGIAACICNSRWIPRAH